MGHHIGQVNTEAENDVFEGFLDRNLYKPGEAAPRNKWFYESGAAKFMFFRDGVIPPIGVMGFTTRLFNTPLGLKVGAIAADLCIDYQYRDVQSALALVKLGVTTVLNSKGVDFVYTIPNRNSKGIIKKTGLFQSAGIFQRQVKLVSFREYLENKRTRIFRPIIDLGWKFATNAHNLRWLTYTLDFGNGFDQATTVWDSYANNPTNMGTRDKLYMKWRFADTPDQKYKVLHISHRGRHAYLVYVVIKNRAYVVDLLYPKGDDDMLLRMFSAMEWHAHKKRYSMIVVQHLGCDDEVSVLKEKLWYRTYKPTTKELFVSTTDATLMTHLVTSDQYWFAGDEDDIQ